MPDSNIQKVSTFHIGDYIYKYHDDSIDDDLSKKVDKVDGKALSSNDFTNEYQAAVRNIIDHPENYINPSIDAAISVDSPNPVQNQAIKNYVDTEINKVKTIATTTTPGIIKVGTNLTISLDGTLSAAAPFQLEPATSAFIETPRLGGVMIGEGLTITDTGILSATGGGSGSAVKDDLYINSGTTQESTVTLSDDYDQYDILYFTIINNSNKIISSIETSKIEVNDILQITEDDVYEVTSKTVFTFTSTPSANSYLESIVGIGLSGGGGANSLNELSDVTISTPTDGQILKYDDQNDIWTNEDLDTGIHYSTTEQVIGTWIDGKPLYRKVISANSVAADSLSAALVLNVDFFATEFINCHDDISNSIFSPGTMSTYNIAGAGNDYATVHKTIDNELKILNTNRANTMTVIASVIYTKTTDISN